MSEVDQWSLWFRLRVAAALVLVDRFPELAGGPGVDSDAVALAVLARWFDREIPDDIEPWRRRFEAIATSAPVEVVLGLRGRRAMRFADRSSDPLLGVNIGPGVRFTNDLAVAVAVDACLSGGRAVALPWNETGVDLTSLVDVADAAGSEPPISVDSAAQARLVVEAWGPGAKGIMTVRTADSARMRVINVVNEGGKAILADHTLACRVTLSGAVRPGVDPHLAGRQALDDIVTSSPFTTVRLWRTQDLPGAQRLPDNLMALSTTERRQVMESRLQNELAAHPDPPSMLEEVMARVEFLSDLRYTRWLLRQIQLGALTFLPGQLTTTDAAELVPLTGLDGALLDLVSCGRAVEHGSNLELTVADEPEVQRRLELLGEVLVRDGAVDGLPEGFIEARIPHRSQHRLTTSDRGYQPPLPPLAPPTEPPPRRAMSWIDMNRALSPGSRKTNCWFVAAAVSTYLTDGSLSVALPRYLDPVTKTDLETVSRVPDYLKLVGAGPASFVTTKAEAEAIARSWGPGQHGLIAATLNRDSTHLFNVLFDGKDVRFVDGYAGLPGDFQFDITWERIGICHLGTLDARFVNPSAASL